HGRPRPRTRRRPARRTRCSAPGQGATTRPPTRPGGAGAPSSGGVGGPRQNGPVTTDAADALAGFSPATRTWFAGAFEAPTAAQTGAWSAARAGDHALVVAPTGSGKTLAAFLWSLDRLLVEPVPEPAQRCRVVYVSPLKALASDVERNLRSPLVGIRQAAARAGVDLPEVTVGVRT